MNARNPFGMSSRAAASAIPSQHHSLLLPSPLIISSMFGGGFDWLGDYSTVDCVNLLPCNQPTNTTFTRTYFQSFEVSAVAKLATLLNLQQTLSNQSAALHRSASTSSHLVIRAPHLHDMLACQTDILAH